MDPNKSMDRKNSEKQYRLENSFKVNGTNKKKKHFVLRIYLLENQ